jgi:hypothetical protein
MAYLGRQPNTGVRSRYIFTATASQTTFSGTDDDGKTLKYEDAAYLDVFLNGVLLKPVTDYTATSKTSVVLTSGAAVSDIVEIVAYDIANIADTVSKTNGGTFEADVTVQGTVTADGLTVDTNTLYVDAANNRVGIGTISPSEVLEVRKDTTTSYGAKIQITNGQDYGYGASLDFAMPLSSGGAVQTAASIRSGYHSVDDGFLAFYTTLNSSVNEAARIDKDGIFMVGKTASNFATDGFQTKNQGETWITRTGTPMAVRRNGSNGNLMTIYRDATTVGSISVTTSATSYNTSSDYRLKENVADLTGAIDRVKQVPVHRFNFIADPDKTVDGFLAHEVADVVPEAITGTKDEVDDEGNPVYQGIDQSKLVPLLTAALQEAVAKIEALEARVATLENA